MSDVGCEANHRWRKEEFLLLLIFSRCWIRHISNVDYYINRWSWTDFIVDVEKKCWTADWLLMLVVILIRWILHHSAYHSMPQVRNIFLCRHPIAILFLTPLTTLTNGNWLQSQKWESINSFTTATMLVSQTNPVGVELFFYANAFFCSNKFA